MPTLTKENDKDLNIQVGQFWRNRYSNVVNTVEKTRKGYPRYETSRKSDRTIYEYEKGVGYGSVNTKTGRMSDGGVFDQIDSEYDFVEQVSNWAGDPLVKPLQLELGKTYLGDNGKKYKIVTPEELKIIGGFRPKENSRYQKPYLFCGVALTKSGKYDGWQNFNDNGQTPGETEIRLIQETEPQEFIVNVEVSVSDFCEAAKPDPELKPVVSDITLTAQIRHGQYEAILTSVKSSGRYSNLKIVDGLGRSDKKATVIANFNFGPGEPTRDFAEMLIILADFMGVTGTKKVMKAESNE